MTNRNRLYRRLNLWCIVLCLVICSVVLVFRGGQAPATQTPSFGIHQTETVLVVGIGDDPSERENTNLTDTILLLNIDKTNQSVTALQIPRDTYVGDITPTGKINAIYNRPEDQPYHGLEGLQRRVEELFAVSVDHYVVLNMAGFAELVDAVGGIPMKVEQKMSYKGVTIEPGEQVLDGKHALVFVRTRNIYATGDIGRVSAQQQFLKAAAAKAKDLGFFRMLTLLPKVIHAVDTDYSIGELLSLLRMAKQLGAEDFNINLAPGEPAMIGGQSVYLLDAEQNAAILNEQFRSEGQEVAASDLGISNE